MRHILKNKRWETLWFILGSLFLFYSHLSFGTSIPGDTNYYKYREKITNTYFIFPPEILKRAPKIVELYKRLDKYYQQSFDWFITGKRNFIFTSSYNQTPNAFATLFPLRLNYYYWGGVEFIEYYASQSWLFDVVSHELSHMYQMDPSKGFGKFTADVFGHTPIAIYPGIPMWAFPYPNALQLTWILEGNAVFNESRFGSGGRLYSGEFKALFNTLIKSINLSTKRINNSHLQFPYNTEKYVLGGFFNLFLAQKYGIKKVNSYFKSHASHYLNPFATNISFQKHFETDYSTLVEEFLQCYKEKFKDIRILPQAELTTSLIDTPLNSDAQEIFFITQSTGTQKNFLWILNKNTLEAKKLKNYFYAGKVFKVDNQYVTRSIGKFRDNKEQYALWSTLGKVVPNTQGKFFMDIKSNDQLYSIVAKNYEVPYLMHKTENSEVEIGKINSHALLSEDKKPIYFKQRKNQRSLYHGEELIYSYKGFYGKITDVDALGNIYFIANTPYGSNAYKINLKEKICYELFASDRIVDVRFVKTDTFLVREIGEKGFLYKLVSLPNQQKLKIIDPYWDEYLFEKEPEFSFFEDWKMTRTKPSTKKEVLPNLKNYNSAKDLQFSLWNMATYWGDGALVDTNFLWVDPLLVNMLNFGIENNFDTKIHEVRLGYRSNRFRIMPFIELQANYYDEFPQRDGYNQNLVPSLKYGVNFPYYIRPRILLSSKLFHFASLCAPTIGEIVSGMKLKFWDLYFLSFDYHQLMDIEWEFALGTRGRNKFNLQANMAYDFGANMLFAMHGQYLRSYSGKLILGMGLEEQKGIIPTKEMIFYEYPYSTYNSGKGLEGTRLGLLFKPTINMPILFEKFPFGIRRFAPMLIYNGYWIKGTWLDNWLARPQYGFGVTWELLIIHNYPLKVHTSYLYNKHTQENNFLIDFNLEI